MLNLHSKEERLKLQLQEWLAVQGLGFLNKDNLAEKKEEQKKMEIPVKAINMLYVK